MAHKLKKEILYQVRIQLLQRKMIFFIIITAFFFTLTSAESIYFVAERDFTLDVEYLFTSGRTSDFNALLYILCAIVPLLFFDEELRKGCWKYLVQRMGKEEYVLMRVRSFYILTNIFCIVALTLYLIILILVGAALKIPVVNREQELIIPLTQYPFFDFSIRILTLSLFASCWSLLALIMLIIKRDIFVACATPVFLYLVINYFSKKLPFPYNIGLPNMENLLFSGGILNKAIQFDVAILAVSYILGILSIGLLRRKINNA